MPEILEWPDGFDNPTPVGDLDYGLGFLSFLEELRAAGVSVLAEQYWSEFQLCRGGRCIEFTRRGRSTALDGRETYWEVRPTENGTAHRLGPLYGLPEYSCIVVRGLANIRTIAMRWLDGIPLVDAIRGVTAWDRMHPSVPLNRRE